MNKYLGRVKQREVAVLSDTQSTQTVHSKLEALTEG